MAIWLPLPHNITSCKFLSCSLQPTSTLKWLKMLDGNKLQRTWLRWAPSNVISGTLCLSEWSTMVVRLFASQNLSDLLSSTARDVWGSLATVVGAMTSWANSTLLGRSLLLQPPKLMCSLRSQGGSTPKLPAGFRNWLAEIGAFTIHHCPTPMTFSRATSSTA